MLKKLKLRQILISTIVAIMVLIPAVVNADTANVNVSGSTGGSFTFEWTYGSYFSPVGVPSQGNLNLHSASDFSGNVFCMNPYAAFYGGIKTVLPIRSYYTNLSQYDVNYLAAGVDYILNRAGIGAYATKNAIAQVWIWTYVSGKTTVNITSYNYTGTGSELFAGVKVQADNWAAANAATCTGAGYVYVGANDGLSMDHSKGQVSARFTVSYGGYLTLTKVTASNSELVKLCPENYSLEGATYRISASPDFSNNAGELVVNADGTANTIYIPQAGRYYAKEIVAPKGYKLDSRIYEIDVVSGQTATLRVSDEPLFDPLTLKVQKKAAEGVDKNLSLEGAEYTVKYYKEYITEEQAKTATPFRTWIFATKTDSKGNTYFQYNDKWKVGGDELFKLENGIPVGLLGTYTVEETKAPRGFARTEGIISLQHVKVGNTFDTVTVLKDVVDTEKEQTVSIEINKKDAETGENKPQGKELGGSLAGAKYDVFYYDALTNEMVKAGTITTDEKGYGKLQGLKPRIYKVVETIASAGYLVDKTEKEIKAGIKEPNTANFNYVVESLEKPITVEVEKTGLNEQGVKSKIAGAKLQLKKADGTALSTWTTEKDKSRIFKGLPKGNYILHEVEAPKGYAKAADITFEVSETEDVQKVSMHDDHTKVKISKQDITTGKELPGAELEIVDEHGNTYDKWISTDKPHFIERMPVGKYILKEKVHPDGYLFASEIQFEVKETGEVQTVTMKDDYTKIDISKQDITNGKELPGAKLKVVDQDGKTVDEWTSGSEPHRINRLKTGKYTLIEELAPKGYVTATNITFEVKETGEVQKVVMKDDITRTEFTKTDAKTGKLLVGATMQILDDKGKVVKEWVSEDKPTKFEKLPVGKYTLHEAKAPLRYDLAPDISFEVKDTADVQSYTMADKVKIGKIIIDDKFRLGVNTGDFSYFYMYIMVLIAAASIFVTAKLYQRNNK
ncbi:MAG: SpaA isopeptide-forming pilin-related protein [Eubacterium sp.]|nr:SpaA isopeptide-forming pilin-related protein [Eubacterium sp.]